MAIRTAVGRHEERSSAHRGSGAPGWSVQPWCSSRRDRARPGVGASGMERRILPLLAPKGHRAKDQTSFGYGPGSRGDLRL
jgi:hypothetical protein